CVALLACLLPACAPGKAPESSILDTTAPAFCHIEQWGPQSVHAGERFNERDDGYSASSLTPARVPGCAGPVPAGSAAGCPRSSPPAPEPSLRPPDPAVSAGIPRAVAPRHG